MVSKPQELVPLTLAEPALTLTENPDLDEVKGLEDGSDEGSSKLQEVRNFGLEGSTAHGRCQPTITHI